MCLRARRYNLRKPLPKGVASHQPAEATLAEATLAEATAAEADKRSTAESATKPAANPSAAHLSSTPDAAAAAVERHKAGRLLGECLEEEWHLMRETIRRNQMHSDAINHAIRRNLLCAQMHSDATRRNQMQSDALRCT